MSDLQIVLIIIGSLIIAGVIVFNWWQERKFRHHLERSFSSLHNDALLDDPKLDVANLKSVIDETEDDFSFEHRQDLEFSDNPLKDTTLIVENQSEELGPDNDAIAIAIAPNHLNEPSDLLQKEFADFSDENQNKNVDEQLSKSTKTTLKHEGIRTIFSDAFNHSVKTGMQKSAVNEVSQETIKAKIAQDQQEGSKKSIHDSELTLPEMLHPQIDLTSVMYLSKETPLKTVHDFFTGFAEAYDKSVFIHVLLLNNQWLQLNQIASDPQFLNAQISRVSCSMQLADRAGAVSRSTLNRFQMAVETLGLDISAHVEWQGTGDALSVAKELDAFCIEVDKTVGFHLVHGESGAFTGTKLRGLAEAQGFTMSDGTFKYFDNDQSLEIEPSFIMFNRDPYPFSAEMLRSALINGVTFQLDIPRVKQCAEAYSQMVQVAKQMKVGLNSLLVADNNKELGDMQIEKIRQQLKVIQATMLTRGITPGSDSALRLFS